jgi:thioredoxin 1
MHGSRASSHKHADPAKAITLLDFYADWCAPCRLVSPLLADLAHEFQGKIQLVEVNVDTESEMVNKYGIYSIPTVVFIQNGQEMHRIIGAKTKNQYRNAMLKLLQSKRRAKS